MTESDKNILHNLLVFARLLRSAGLSVTSEQVGDLSAVLAAIGITRREDVYNAARALFVHRRADLPVFDRAFDLFFNIHGKPQQTVIDPTQSPARRAWRPKNIRQLASGEQTRSRDESKTPESDPAETALIYSPFELLRQKNFDLFTPEEIRTARMLIAEMDWQMGERKTRRKRPARRGRQIDFTQLLRRNLSRGTELFALPTRVPKYKQRPLIVLADISGSMERYTRMVLHLLHALYHEQTGLEVFTFGTQLTRITADLARRSVDAALARVSRRVPDWSGGTRIGDTLKTFNFRWARRVLRGGPVVLIISDGWDRGDLELLRDEIARLQRSCFRLIWLNPLLGSPTFEPTAQGLQVALPFVDDFMPVHNLVSLEMLVEKLASLREERPLRRQQRRVAIPSAQAVALPAFMERPQMGTSDYIRRTMTLESIDGVPQFRYRENPDEK